MSNTLSQTEQVLVGGQWKSSDQSSTFQSSNPATGEKLDPLFPVSTWADCDAALDAAAEAFGKMRSLPAAAIADFLEDYAAEIERRADDLVAAAHRETALPVSPRLQDVELPRTTGQLRQAAAAARSQVWRNPVIDTAAGIRSCLGPLGPVCVFGPNNFPFAFGSISGGDFAAALAAGNPVIGKANSSHPETTRLFGEAVHAALQRSQLPAAAVQLIYRTSHADGERLVSDPRVAATGYTGSRSAGLKLKTAAEQAGKLIFLELSSCNPVFILPGALLERGEEIAGEFSGSCLMGTGQFCTNPGLVILENNAQSAEFISQVSAAFASSASGKLLSAGVADSLREGIDMLVRGGAQLITGSPSTTSAEPGFSVTNSLLQITGEQFLQQPELFQTEIFGNAALFVLAADTTEMERISGCLEGNLTGCIYSDSNGRDDAVYELIEPQLRARVGRLLNDKMPTGVAVSPAMNHGGPYPATGNPHFTAVGMPAAIGRFAALHCYDNVRGHRLPPCLQDKNPHADLQRCVDGVWTNRSLD